VKGTTIVGIVFKDGVILGADTRATNESIVCDKVTRMASCELRCVVLARIACARDENRNNRRRTAKKSITLHPTSIVAVLVLQLTQKIPLVSVRARSDVAQICALFAAMVSSQLKLHSMATGRQALVVTALTMLKQYLFQYQGHVSAALILGGVDRTGPSLYTVYPHGSTDRLPFVTMGSGSLAAMAIFEAEWAPQLELDAGVALVQRAVLAGIFNDLGSGGNVDVTVRSDANVCRLTVPFGRS
jgi:20S proteasome subunit beta 2